MREKSCAPTYYSRRTNNNASIISRWVASWEITPHELLIQLIAAPIVIGVLYLFFLSLYAIGMMFNG